MTALVKIQEAVMPRRLWSVRKIKTWPPGTIMMFNNSRAIKEKGLEGRVAPHIGFGIVISNDGIDSITVVWGGNCEESVKEYCVPALNDRVVFRVG